MELKAEIIGHIAGLPITNTFLTTLIVATLLILLSYIYSRKVELIPGTYQNIIEAIIEFLYNTAYTVVGKHSVTRRLFPLIATFFIFILVSNWFGLLPIFHGIGFTLTNGTFVPLLRPINSDLNTTGALAIISMVATQYYAISYVGIIAHIKRYISLNPIYLFVGLLELVSEFTKIISLSFRLFGNIYAGDIVISSFTNISSIFIFSVLLPLPFMGLELVVGFVQAAVFAMLTLAFTNILIQKH